MMMERFYKNMHYLAGNLKENAEIVAKSVTNRSNVKIVHRTMVETMVTEVTTVTTVTRLHRITVFIVARLATSRKTVSS